MISIAEIQDDQRYPLTQWNADFVSACERFADGTGEFIPIFDLLQQKHPKDSEIEWKALRLYAAFAFSAPNVDALRYFGLIPPSGPSATSEFIALLYEYFVPHEWTGDIPVPNVAEFVMSTCIKHGLNLPALNRLVQTRECATADEFVRSLSPRAESFQSVFPKGWIFRGHGDDSFILVPSALRSGSQNIRLFGPPTPHTNAEQIDAEREVLRSFLDVSDRNGLHVPEDNQRLRKLLQYGGTQIETWPPEEVLSPMALAQHHGVPTRLLDWSWHPLKAALFAAGDALNCKNPNQKLSVWALAYDKWELLGDEPLPFEIVTAPTATNSNLRAQEGVFTLGKRCKRDKCAVDRTPFDTLLVSWAASRNVSTSSPFIQRISLPASEAERLCFILAMEGVNRASLFPNFAGVVMAMKDTALWYTAGHPGDEHAAAAFPSYNFEIRTSPTTIVKRRLLTKRQQA